jgi:queuine tRNA-ribosyltransferase
LLTAGFAVAEGVGTGPKADTTLAFTQLSAARAHPASPRLLGSEWLARWQRSGSKFPAGLPIEERAAFEQGIWKNPQFSPESGQINNAELRNSGNRIQNT